MGTVLLFPAHVYFVPGITTLVPGAMNDFLLELLLLELLQLSLPEMAIREILDAAGKKGQIPEQLKSFLGLIIQFFIQ